MLSIFINICLESFSTEMSLNGIEKSILSWSKDVCSKVYEESSYCPTKNKTYLINK